MRSAKYRLACLRTLQPDLFASQASCSCTNPSAPPSASLWHRTTPQALAQVLQSHIVVYSVGLPVLEMGEEFKGGLTNPKCGQSGLFAGVVRMGLWMVGNLELHLCRLAAPVPLQEARSRAAASPTSRLPFPPSPCRRHRPHAAPVLPAARIWPGRALRECCARTSGARVGG